ncbi:SDR family oxidoreductase [bacterium]|jgi:meso-butanediol dehydrogenase/(S,S)-butanediol dehydrogenase/diacetyl reductase|nr:SDR family oxidoreductase [bacterium]
MAGKLDGKVAIVTAGGAGIGAATARRFAAEGAAVVVADLSGTRAEQVRGEIAAAGGRAAAIKIDASDPAAIEATVRMAIDSFGRLDVMFNNAGMAEVSLIHETSLESWSRVIAVTLTSTFLGLKYAIPIMRAQKSGVVINTASISGTRGDYGMGSYNAAKAGVINLTRTAALENARFGIRVNCVCPGGINTRVAQVLGKDRADEFRRTMGAAHPIGRMGEPEEIAATVTFLASDESSFITGASIVADGGITAWTGMPRMPGAK